jgi:hypothetical protein
MALAVEHLSSEWETLSSNPSTEKKKKKRRRRRRRSRDRI